MIHFCAFCGSQVDKSDPLPGAERAAEIIRAVADEHNVSPAFLVGPRRFPLLCLARFCAMGQLRQEGYMLKEIGLFLGGRNHASVIHGLRRWEEIKAIQSAVRGLRQVFQAVPARAA